MGAVPKYNSKFCAYRFVRRYKRRLANTEATTMCRHIRAQFSEHTANARLHAQRDGTAARARASDQCQANIAIIAFCCERVYSYYELQQPHNEPHTSPLTVRGEQHSNRRGISAGAVVIGNRMCRSCTHCARAFVSHLDTIM